MTKESDGMIPVIRDGVEQSRPFVFVHGQAEEGGFLPVRQLLCLHCGETLPNSLAFQEHDCSDEPLVDMEGLLARLD